LQYPLQTFQLSYKQGCSGAGTRGNGVPTYFLESLDLKTCIFTQISSVYSSRRRINEQVTSYSISCVTP